MRDDKSIHYFDKEVSCFYKKERYSVRDNGTVLKHSQVGKRHRPTDNLWIFGKPNNNTGYMEIASVRVHRIVATAFHGEPPIKEHVVDHIDTNKRNNRPENLRWVTRLENVLLNPITIKRIVLACGCNIEEFLSERSKFREKFLEPNYKWMCTVSKQEAQASLERMLSWAKSDKLISGGSLGEWIFNRTTSKNHQIEIASTVQDIPEISDTIKAKTVNAIQINWRVPSEFPCCPQEFTEEPIKTYAENLKVGSVFCKNEYYCSFVLECAISDDNQSIFGISEGENIKPWTLAKITYENSLFVHTSLGSFFTQEGVEKHYCLAQGLAWNGGDTLDDLL